MYSGCVVGQWKHLAVVLPHDLPVRLHVVVDDLGDLGAGEALRLQGRSQQRLDGARSPAACSASDRKISPPTWRRATGRKPSSEGGTPCSAVVSRSSLPAGVVGPGVVGADEGAVLAALIGAQARAAMAADIVEAADLAVAPAHDDRRVMADLVREPVAGLGISQSWPANCQPLAKIVSTSWSKIAWSANRRSPAPSRNDRLARISARGGPPNPKRGAVYGRAALKPNNRLRALTKEKLSV